MIHAPVGASVVEKGAIRSHYDLATPFYRLLWGPHIHHGLWSDEDVAREIPLVSPRSAQEHLTDTLAALGGVTEGDRLLDVGCGMGGSSNCLARRLARTWELCDARVKRLGLPWGAGFVDRRQADFLEHFRSDTRSFWRFSAWCGSFPW